MFRSALYAGTVMHQRLRPRRHRLSYRIFQTILDLDEIDALAERLRLFSRNRFNVFSFFDRDHGDGSDEPLKAQVGRQLKAAGIDADDGSVRLLCMPRVFGYVFNPISIYFCHRRDGGLAALLYEVTNTFGQRHSYLIPAGETSESGIVEQHCRKGLYVSPFLGMDMDYRFRIAPPDDRLLVHITGRDARGPLIVAAFSGARRPLGDMELARALFAYPLLTLKVIAGIHWEALLLWIKGVRLQHRPAPPARAVTHVAIATQSHRKSEVDVHEY